MEKRWVFQQQPSPQHAESLSQVINVSKTIASLLLQKGIDDFDKAKDFFRPSLSQLHDPFLMADMENAVERLEEAISDSQNILIYGDYDVDGTTSVAMMYHFLKSIYPNVAFYIPDRYKEGYGISEIGIDWAADNEFDLIISLDCGIKALKQVQKAKDLGIDLIICDHHKPGEKLPEAVAVLDPKRSDCEYPYKELSGCGVGFKLLQGYSQKNNIDLNWLYSYLDFVVVSIASDIVPITGENRILSSFGLQKLNKQPRVGLQALMSVAGMRGEVDISNIVFGIGPRINAAGRIDHAEKAVEVLISDNKEEAEEFAYKVNQDNLSRREFDSTTTEEALEMIENGEGTSEKYSTVLFKDNWHKGVIGIVASRCIEKYYRPTIILTESNGKATGSARSVRGFDVYEAISECSDLLHQFGGHQYAAGLTMDLKNVNAFQEKFEKVVARKIKPEHLVPEIKINAFIELNTINYKFYNLFKQMQPFGPGNMQPAFMAENLRIKNPKLLKEKHLKFDVSQEGFQEHFTAIGFGFGHFYQPLTEGKSFKMVFVIEENEYRGEKSLQLRIKDLKLE